MLKNEEYHSLIPLFNNIRCNVSQPSDIDMFYITQDKFLILGEFKNGDYGKLDKQKWLFEYLINNHKGDGIVIYATHHHRVEDGDRDYDASLCIVEEYYWRGKWYKPKSKITVQDVFDKFDKEKKDMNIIDEKDKTKIKIKEAWLDFYKADKKTVPYIFINKFEMASDMDAMKQVSDIEEMPFY